MQSSLYKSSFSEDIDALYRILDDAAITPHFQPIYDLLSGDVVGHEALSRGPQGSPLEMPDKLFSTAINCGKLHELELLCREKSLRRFSELGLSGKLFLNISASLLSSPDHQKGMTLSLLERLNISRDRIVIELSEQHPYDHFGLSRASVEYYRRMGFNIAIDDLGVGYSGLRMWSELQPEYVKIDKHFVQGVDKDTVKREFIRSIIAIAQSLRCEVIAEGIETTRELESLLDLGITRGQGFLLGRPVIEPSCKQSKFLTNSSRRFELRHAVDEQDRVSSLAKEVPSVSKDTDLGTVGQLFKSNPVLQAVPVLSNATPVGVVRRSDLMELFSTQYGRALYEHKQVTRLLRDDVLIVEGYVSLSKVSYQLTNQDNNNLNNEIIVVEDGCYVGMGSLRDLLKRITDLKIQNATYSNPLSLLPGSVPINRELDRRLNSALDFYLAYFDLNNFKPFNDHYGYARGDLVIQLLSQIIKREASNSANFIGHIGGDDFVVIFGSDNWQVVCQKILDQFAQQVKDLYSPKAIQEGGLWVKGRTQEVSFYETLSLAIGVVHPDPYACESYHEVAELAAQAKKEAKEMGGNAIFLSRRRKMRSESARKEGNH